MIYWIEWVTVISVGTMGCNAACSPSSCYTLCDKDVRLTRDKGQGKKMLSAPPALIATAGRPLPIKMMQNINDHFAALVAANPKHLLALATIDAFLGDAAAREVACAIQTLGMGGICVDCARHGKRGQRAGVDPRRYL